MKRTVVRQRHRLIRLQVSRRRPASLNARDDFQSRPSTPVAARRLLVHWLPWRTVSTKVVPGGWQSRPSPTQSQSVDLNGVFRKRFSVLGLSVAALTGASAFGAPK